MGNDKLTTEKKLELIRKISSLADGVTLEYVQSLSDIICDPDTELAEKRLRAVGRARLWDGLQCVLGLAGEQCGVGEVYRILVALSDNLFLIFFVKEDMLNGSYHYSSCPSEHDNSVYSLKRGE